MICTFYSQQTGFDKIVTLVRQLYPKAEINISADDEPQAVSVEIKGGFLRPGKRFRISYRQLNEAVAGTDDMPLKNNLNGLYNYVRSLPAKNEQVKDLLLKKINVIKAEFSIIEEQGQTREIITLIQSLAQDFDAVIFAQPGTVISRSYHQHFLNKELRLIIDTNGDCEIDTLEVDVPPEPPREENPLLKPDQVERRERTEDALRELDVKINQHLPCVESEEETTIRTIRAIAERTVILAVTNMVAFDNMTGDEAINYLTDNNLWDEVTPGEKLFLAEPTNEKKLAETWKCEAIWVLMWALKKVDQLGPPGELCNLRDIPHEEYPLGKNKPASLFINQEFEARTKSEILDANDLYYRLDWAVVDARLNRRNVQGVNGGLVYERHYALNWLINYMDYEWDDVSCDT
jgi:hypothetical protein